ncbi:hypothetical protein JG688_00012335 [Phytophthora aleatoria]|uniref:Uncharacterized protein n=1 Tax=Phytophthora aleatoria TaxID=2496075 RepID=A0A8J5IQ60_9STRA|nr:hypothetical protein JG688_00012335 [Phytophthora aleatoria]
MDFWTGNGLPHGLQQPLTVIKSDWINYALQTAGGTNGTVLNAVELLAIMSDTLTLCTKSRELPAKVKNSLSIPYGPAAMVSVIRPDTLVKGRSGSDTGRERKAVSVSATRQAKCRQSARDASVTNLTKSHPPSQWLIPKISALSNFRIASSSTPTRTTSLYSRRRRMFQDVRRRPSDLQLWSDRSTTQLLTLITKVRALNVYLNMPNRLLKPASVGPHRCYEVHTTLAFKIDGFLLLILLSSPRI